MNSNKTCLIILGALFVAMECCALWIDSRYKWDFIFVMLLLVGVYLVRELINLHPIHYALFGVFLLLHFAGMFGWYQTFPLGLEYDHWVHGFFGFVAALMVLRAYYFYGVYPPALIAVAAVAVILGFSAFHEIFEYAGALAVGEGEGVLFIGAGDLDEWDTQKDMLNNLIGAILGLSVFYTSKYWRSRRPEGQCREENNLNTEYGLQRNEGNAQEKYFCFLISFFFIFCSRLLGQPG